MSNWDLMAVPVQCPVVVEDFIGCSPAWLEHVNYATLRLVTFIWSLVTYAGLQGIFDYQLDDSKY